MRNPSSRRRPIRFDRPRILIERGSFGNFQHDLTRKWGEHAAVRKELVVFEIQRVQVDEHEHALGNFTHGGRHQLAKGAAELLGRIESLRDVEQIGRIAKRWLIGSCQGFVGEDRSILPGDNRLRRDPQPPQSGRKASLLPGAIADWPPFQLWRRRSTNDRQAVPMRGAFDDAREVLGCDGFDQVAKGAVFDGINGAFEVRLPGQEDEGNIEILVPNGPQQGPPINVGHSEVTDDGIERRRLRGFYRLAPATDDGHRETLPRQDPLGCAGDGWLVIDDENARSLVGSRATESRSHTAHAVDCRRDRGPHKQANDWICKVRRRTIGTSQT